MTSCNDNNNDNDDSDNNKNTRSDKSNNNPNITSQILLHKVCIAASRKKWATSTRQKHTKTGLQPLTELLCLTKQDNYWMIFLNLSTKI